MSWHSCLLVSVVVLLSYPHLWQHKVLRVYMDGNVWTRSAQMQPPSNEPEAHLTSFILFQTTSCFVCMQFVCAAVSILAIKFQYHVTLSCLTEDCFLFANCSTPCQDCPIFAKDDDQCAPPSHLRTLSASTRPACCEKGGST